MIYKFKDKYPEFGINVFIAESADVIGDVVIGNNSSVWFNSVIRGDVHSVRIGSNTNIQDGCILHVTGGLYNLEIGDNVTAGHNAVIHGCKIGNNVLIGMGSVILDRAVINDNSLVAAGSVVREGFEIPEGVLAAGVPARIVRKLSEEEIRKIGESADGYSELAKEYMK